MNSRANAVSWLLVHFVEYMTNGGAGGFALSVARFAKVALLACVLSTLFMADAGVVCELFLLMVHVCCLDSRTMAQIWYDLDC